MPSTQLLQWSLWGLSLLAGAGAILASFKLRYAERFLPQWNELKELEAILPVRQEELRQATEGIEKCRTEIGQLEATVGHLRILKEWQDANPEAPARIQQMMADIERFNAEKAAVQQKLAQDEQRLNEVTQETTRLTLEKAQLTQEAGALRDQLTALHKQEADLEGIVRELDEQRRQLETKVTGLKNDIQSTETRLSALQQQLKQDEQEKAAAIRERDQARADRDAARAELIGLQRSVEALKGIAEGLKFELGKTPALGAGDYADLFARVSFGQLPPARAVQNEREVLEQARNYIRGKGLVFPERVMYAFHTSLKAGDISPLVVLAGRSGTGKSELPRHYADGMGMHFLLVAVQPRWDSPQDLFGFYNYLEKRYKATELARALVQFELFNKTAWKLPQDAKIDDRSDRMLLVLLDEMNLARTEYYFSEFLSKLETRRAVNEGKAEDRARAEIELDTGRLLDGQKGLRLYPGRNVLFVGTMNEDESTQALSDKVIDRASVLRFWRPKRTNPDVAESQPRPPNDGLTFENWKHWLKPITDLGPSSSELDGWIDQLNDALTHVGRPFAYRVDKAIRAYVANYPRWVNAWHKRAMADQIEQRIFPKLRGIEPDLAQDALLAIGRVIEQLDDEPLLKAYRESWENQATFLFRGVVRDERE
jgi:hypothetical protein